MNRGGQIQFQQFPLTPAVKWIIIVTTVIWVLFQLILEGYAGIPFTKYFALFPGKVIYDFQIWQPFTYMVLHTLSVGHLVLNMLMLWFVGAELETRWGWKFFLSYYVITGVGAALVYCLGVAIYFLVTGNQQPLRIPVVGASGAIFGLLIAYGLLFGERIMHFMMIFPMKAKVFVLILATVEIFSLLTTGVAGGEVANLAHLGGFISGYLTLFAWSRYQRMAWNQKAKKKGSKLRLVVDNERDKKTGEGPKYWN
ncbi:MAG: rhomboid family intramembrane serine protease [Oligoflexia bacterium]|nr:MAG: rhomboid family intramembrane serine protease [Oligoflexia bacterium]